MRRLTPPARCAINVTMQKLNLLSRHKAVSDYYAAMNALDAHGADQEGAVSGPFYALMQYCAKKMNATFQREYRMKGSRGAIAIDGAALHESGVVFAYWEAKDIHDNLDKAIDEKREAGYPFQNILFQTPKRAVLFQNEQKTLDVDIAVKANLVKALNELFNYRTPDIENWEAGAAQFRERVPTIADKLKSIIQTQREDDDAFAETFGAFYAICKDAVNPDLSEEAVEEMLIQHIIMERVFRTIFHNSDFTRRNIIAQEIEKVVDALTQQAFSRDDFLSPLDPHYQNIENAAKTRTKFSEKQELLNACYETFFQSYSKDVADTHGIVYTPQPIVDFMVNSVQHILDAEFGRSLSSEGVHIIDPFVGTGNFIVRLMREIDGTALRHKYAHELHCNEVMLLPYYIASLNIEQGYYQRMRRYMPFEGIVFGDTFEIMDSQGSFLTQRNAERVDKQRRSKMTVVIGNPPYNMGQLNENDNNKNRKYELMDSRIKETYAADSKARLKTKLYDPYVKAIRWATNRIKDEGVIAFVTNNSFIEAIAFDGMRKHLEQDFDAVYVLDLGGNARKGVKVADANVFGIRVGVSINLFVKTKQNPSEKARVFYRRTDDLWNKDQKFDFMDKAEHVGGVDWETIQIDARHTWLTGGLRAEFDSFMPLSSKTEKSAKGEAEKALFRSYSTGLNTARDAWTYNSNRKALEENIQRTIDFYNLEVARWTLTADKKQNIDDYVTIDDTKLKWSRNLKRELQRKNLAEYSENKIRESLYRPFTKRVLFFDKIMNDETSRLRSVFPTPEDENRVICVCAPGATQPFQALMADMIPDYHLTGDSPMFSVLHLR